MTTASLWHLTLARLRLSLREPSALFWTFAFPVLLTLALGAAFRNRPPEPVAAAVQDGPGAAEVAAALRRDADVRVQVLGADAARAALRAGRVALVVIPGPSRTYAFDPARPEARLARAVVDDDLQRAAGRADPVAVRDAPVVEPGARYVDFLVPGLVGVNVMSSSMWAVGYAIVETRQKRLLKRLAATPMRRGEFLLSFVLQRMLFLALELPVLFGFAALAFGVAVRGSLALLVGVAALGALAFAGLGLLVASRATNTSTASGLVNLVTLPMFICSGVFFPASYFPDAVQPVVRALPATALNDALRAIVNDGAGPLAVASHAALLAGVAAVSFALALRAFRWT